jgi:hypothetical protein
MTDVDDTGCDDGNDETGFRQVSAPSERLSLPVIEPPDSVDAIGSPRLPLKYGRLVDH